MNEEIIRPPAGISNISEWCKKDACWTGLQGKLGKFEQLLSEEFIDELLSAEDRASEAQARGTEKIDNGIEAQRRVLGIAADEWAKVHKVLSTRKLLSTKEAGNPRHRHADASEDPDREAVRCAYRDARKGAPRRGVSMSAQHRIRRAHRSSAPWTEIKWLMPSTLMSSRSARRRQGCYALRSRAALLLLVCILAALVL